MHLERVQQEQDEEDNKSDEEDNDETNEEEEEEEEEEVKNTSAPKVWYFKLQKWIDHMRDASAALIWILGTYLSIN
eukprot:11829186-Ditylum_brightwellii.AAC.1